MKKQHPYVLIIISFISVILIGTLLLSLPFSSKTGHSIGFVNSLFMSSSAVCVTGLSILPNSVASDFTIFGKVVMFLLMEIGGLSIITIAVFFFTILGAKIGISNRFLLREQLNQSSQQGMFKLVKNIMIMSFTIQIIGTFINWYPIYEFLKNTNGGGIVKAFFMSAFHSCASFNNAGFDVFGDGGMLYFSSEAHIISNISVYILDITTMIMILLGGIGFVILTDVVQKRLHWKNFRLHTKITIIITLCLLIFGGLLLKLTSNMSWLDAFFTAVTCRTAGFQTYNMANLTTEPVAYIICISLMFIGASPCSCGGGIKTTTFAIILISIYHFAIGKKTKAFSRRISDAQIFKAFVLLNLGFLAVLTTTAIVLISQSELTFEKALFESVSAFSTTGLSMGITSSLNIGNKILLSFIMLFGRLGPLTVIGVLNKNWMNDTHEQIEYVEEGVIIG